MASLFPIPLIITLALIIHYSDGFHLRRDSTLALPLLSFSYLFNFTINYAGDLRTFPPFALTSVRIQSRSVKTMGKQFLIQRFTLICLFLIGSSSAFEKQYICFSTDLGNNIIKFCTYGFPACKKGCNGYATSKETVNDYASHFDNFYAKPFFAFLVDYIH